MAQHRRSRELEILAAIAAVCIQPWPATARDAAGADCVKILAIGGDRLENDGSKCTTAASHTGKKPHQKKPGEDTFDFFRHEKADQDRHRKLYTDQDSRRLDDRRRRSELERTRIQHDRLEADRKDRDAKARAERDARTAQTRRTDRDRKARLEADKRTERTAKHGGEDGRGTAVGRAGSGSGRNGAGKKKNDEK